MHTSLLSMYVRCNSIRILNSASGRVMRWLETRQSGSKGIPGLGPGIYSSVLSTSPAESVAVEQKCSKLQDPVILKTWPASHFVFQLHPNLGATTWASPGQCQAWQGGVCCPPASYCDSPFPSLLVSLPASTWGEKGSSLEGRES